MPRNAADMHPSIHSIRPRCKLGQQIRLTVNRAFSPPLARMRAIGFASDRSASDIRAREQRFPRPHPFLGGGGELREQGFQVPTALIKL